MIDIEKYKTELKEQVKRQREFFATGKTKNLDFRIEHLRKLRVALDTYEKDILNALKLDLGKSFQESYFTELSLIIDEIKLHARKIKKWAEAEKVNTPIWLLPSKSYRTFEPLGQILIISPWNYPFQLAMYPLIGALSAGNCAMIKPSPLCPHTNLVIKKIINSIFPPEYVTILDSENEYTLPTLDEKFDLVLYTGNSTFARQVMRAASATLTPVILELGGKNPCIVDVDCNMEVATKRIVWGKLLNAGQTCVAPDYFFVNKTVVKEFIENIKKNIINFYGANAEKSPYYPRIITSNAVKRLSNYLEDGKVIYGGKYDEDKKYFEPTIITDIVADSAITNEEVFGPIFPIFTYSELDEPIKYINSKPKPLAIYFFGEDKPAETVLEKTSSGGACVNDVVLQLGNPKLPFGGVGESGMGKYHGWYSFRAFSNERSFMISYYRIDNIFKYVPFKYFSIAKRILGTTYNK